VSEEEFREIRATFALKAVSNIRALNKSQTDSDISDIGGNINRLLRYRC
jgi:hypothetical protein